jgi:hypothetical protein
MFEFVKLLCRCLSAVVSTVRQNEGGSYPGTISFWRLKSVYKSYKMIKACQESATG